MTVVSTKEFNTNQDKYFDMALDEEICIKKGDNMFIVQNFTPNDEPDVICEPDEDFYKSITMEEFRKRAKVVVQNVHNRYFNESHNIASSS